MKNQTVENEGFTTYRHCEERSNPEKRELDCFVPRNDVEYEIVVSSRHYFVSRNDDNIDIQSLTGYCYVELTLIVINVEQFVPENLGYGLTSGGRFNNLRRILSGSDIYLK